MQRPYPGSETKTAFKNYTQWCRTQINIKLDIHTNRTSMCARNARLLSCIVGVLNFIYIVSTKQLSSSPFLHFTHEKFFPSRIYLYHAVIFLWKEKRGVNRGMQIRRSVPFFAKSVDLCLFSLNPPIRAYFSLNPSIRQNFCSNPKPQPHPKTEV